MWYRGASLTGESAMANHLRAAVAFGLVAAYVGCSCNGVKAVAHPKALGAPCGENLDCQSNLCGDIPGVDAGAGGGVAGAGRDGPREGGLLPADL